MILDERTINGLRLFFPVLELALALGFGLVEAREIQLVIIFSQFVWDEDRREDLQSVEDSIGNSFTTKNTKEHEG